MKIKRAIYRMLQMITDKDDLNRIYKLVQYLYTHKKVRRK